MVMLHIIHSSNHKILVDLECPLVVVHMANNPVYHARTKHIEVHYHYVREKVLLGLIDLVYVSTEDQVADIFTKSLGAEKLRKFRDLLGVQEL